jgi:hypothetical protein
MPSFDRSKPGRRRGDQRPAAPLGHVFVADKDIDIYNPQKWNGRWRRAKEMI